MVSLKKVLIPIVLLLALLPLGTVSADIGPKPTMDFEFIQQTPGAALTIAGTAIFFECEQADCQDEKPLGVGGPQRFSCGTISCHVLAYGFTRYHRLEIQFSDGKTRKSNVFQTAHFNSVYKVTIRPDDLLVEPQFGWDSFSNISFSAVFVESWCWSSCWYSFLYGASVKRSDRHAFQDDIRSLA